LGREFGEHVTESLKLSLIFGTVLKEKYLAGPWLKEQEKSNVASLEHQRNRCLGREPVIE
jgi:hypothetical protein